MTADSPTYRREYIRSPHHAWLAVLSVGVGLACGHVLAVIAGVTVYALGWIYLPDSRRFRAWVDGRREAARLAADQVRVAEFVARRSQLMRSLAGPRQARYTELADVCQDIEAASTDEAAGLAAPADARLRRLDELMWTYLRLLSFEQSLQDHLETERHDDLPRLLAEAEQEVARLAGHAAAGTAPDTPADPEAARRLLESRQEYLEVLRRRCQRAEQAEVNLRLVVAEQQRLEQQIKLLRADAVAARSTAAISARIDATVDNLEQTNRWLSEMDEFRAAAGDLPTTDLRVGFRPPPDGSPPASPFPPPLPSPTATAASTRARRPPQQMRTPHG